MNLNVFFLLQCFQGFQIQPHNYWRTIKTPLLCLYLDKIWRGQWPFGLGDWDSWNPYRVPLWSRLTSHCHLPPRSRNWTRLNFSFSLPELNYYHNSYIIIINLKAGIVSKLSIPYYVRAVSKELSLLRYAVVSSSSDIRARKFPSHGKTTGPTGAMAKTNYYLLVILSAAFI